jgi:MFS transporter, FSR family, fosmidomycin resistance protein
VPHGQRYLLTFSLLAIFGIVILARVGNWYSLWLHARRGKAHVAASPVVQLSKSQVVLSISVLLALMFSKFFYLASITSYYTFYLMQKFGVSVQQSQYCLFLYLFAVALGTLGGGILGDRIGRKNVIWLSILGMAPFALLLPHANLAWTAGLSVIIGFLMASAFPAILVYATELLPGRVGMIAGLFFGLAFGLAGIGSAVLGKLADATSISFVMSVCAFLPLIGLLTGFLPNLSREPLSKPGPS